MRTPVRAILGTIVKVGTRLIGLFSPPTIAALAGLGLTVYGLHMLYAPLAYLIPGGALTAFGLWLAGLSLPQHRKRGDD